MARPKKENIDYFPHYCDHGKTLFIIESLYGNDGYAFFYKLLERLGKSRGHFIDCRNQEDWEFLVAKTNVSEEMAENILNKLSSMGKIDTELWSTKIIWMQTFIDSIADVYKNRRMETPVKPNSYKPEPQEAVVSTVHNPQSKVNKSKRTLCDCDEDFEAYWKAYPKHTAKKAPFAEWEKAKKAGLLPPIKVILSAVENQKRARAQAAQTGKFYPEWPDPERWIKKMRWEDVPESLIGSGGGNGRTMPTGAAKLPRPSDVPDPDQEWEETCRRREAEEHPQA